MGKLSMIASLTCQDGKADEMTAVLTRMTEAVRGERGIEVYSYPRSEGNTFWFFAVMADEGSMQSHGQSEVMQAVMEDFRPLMAAVGLDC